MISRRALVAGAFASLTASGCSTSDVAGEVRAGAPGPLRVVSISPSTTEAIFAIGRGAELVGRSRYCDEPPEARSVPEVGGFADPSVERILALTPTLVVGERGPAGPRLVEALEQRGLATYFPPIGTLADIDAFLLGLGERMDAREGASRVIERIHAAASAVDAEVAGRARKRVLFLFDFQPLIAAGPGGFPDELLRRAGGDNVVTSGGAYPQLGVEAVLALDPDRILDGSAPAEGAPDALTMLRAIPGLAELRAVRTGQVARLTGTAAIRPGPRIGEGLAQLARLLTQPLGDRGPSAP